MRQMRQLSLRFTLTLLGLCPGPGLLLTGKLWLFSPLLLLPSFPPIAEVRVLLLTHSVPFPPSLAD